MSAPETFSMTDRQIAANLALAGAFRELIGLELLASVHGASTHYFPPHGDPCRYPDRLTVAATATGYEYLWVDGPVSRETAAHILATDTRREVTV